MPAQLDATEMMQWMFSAFMAILFIQSGLDKVFNWKDEKSFYVSHFKKSILNGTVGILMPVITLSELAAGFLSGIGLILNIFGEDQSIACWGMLFSCLSILMLFFGQRVAKDYAGAMTLVVYFLAAVSGLYFHLI